MGVYLHALSLRGEEGQLGVVVHERGKAEQQGIFGAKHGRGAHDRRVGKSRAHAFFAQGLAVNRTGVAHRDVELKPKQPW